MSESLSTSDALFAALMVGITLSGVTGIYLWLLAAASRRGSGRSGGTRARAERPIASAPICFDGYAWFSDRATDAERRMLAEAGFLYVHEHQD